MRPFGVTSLISSEQHRWLLLGLGLLAGTACKDNEPPTSARPKTEKPVGAASAALAAAGSAKRPRSQPAPVRRRSAVERSEKPDPRRYQWLGDESRDVPEAVDTAYSRFPSPPGYARVVLPKDSFGEWLRHLPLAPKGTPVTSHEGERVHSGDDEYVAGVVAIDVGSGDLQSGPDVVLRLHAEWLWSTGAREQIEYRSATKLDMPFERWMRGERIVSHAGKVFWARAGKSEGETTHEQLRDYLDNVFNWVNSGALLAQSSEVPTSGIRPGDFLIHDGKPGDAVLIVDMARDEHNDRTVVMLARALSPAESVHIVSPGRGIAWFGIAPPTALLTPRTEEFSWENLRRLD